MTFDATGLSLSNQLIGGKYRTWVYKSADAFSTVDNTDYFALMGDGLSGSFKMALGDFVICEKTDDGSVVLAYVSAVDSDYNVTVSAVGLSGALTGPQAFESTLAVTGATTLSSTVTISGAATFSSTTNTLGVATFTSITATGDCNIGNAAADLLAFHGTTAISQRAGSNQATSNVVTSATYGTLQVAQLNEVQNVLITLGLMKGGA